MQKIIFTFLLILSVIQENKAQKPEFGTATDFAIFTTVGAFNNLGNSNITGNIGTNAGAFTGFPQGVVVGTSHVADAVSLQVSLDIDLAYNFMVGLDCDTIIDAGLGNGQILPPNVYCIGSAATFTGDLTLDAKGDADAVFIFKIDGAFTTATFTNILLLNSASYCNVFWQVNGAFILGDGSNFKGNLICNGALSLLEASSVEGKTLTKAGAIDTHNNSISFDPNGCMYTDLPIQLINFTGHCDNKNIILEWKSATETNNDFYTIERSTDCLDWKWIQKINSTGNSNLETNYSYSDIDPNFSKNFYRLYQTDFNGMTQYYPIITTENCNLEINPFTAYPNPTSGKIQLNTIPDNCTNVSIFNSIGKSFFQSNSYPLEIDLSNETKGIYFLSITINNEIFSQKIILE